MKATHSSQLTSKAIQSSSLTALIFKLVGVLLILSFLIDFVVLLTAVKFQDSQSLLTFTTQLIDRGFVPMVGLALIFGGFWLDSVGTTPESGKFSQEQRLLTLLFSSILGLAFLLLIPLNVKSVNDAMATQVKQIEENATKAEGQLDSQVQQVKEQVDARLATLDQAVKSGQVQGEQLTQVQRERDQLQKLKADPKALEAQVAPSRNQALSRIQTQKQEFVSQTRDNGLRSGMRSGLNSLLLAIGYSLIGWVGLRQLLYLRNQRSMPPEL
jgi:hypothetical protein